MAVSLKTCAFACFYTFCCCIWTCTTTQTFSTIIGSKIAPIIIAHVENMQLICSCIYTHLLACLLTMLVWLHVRHWSGFDLLCFGLVVRCRAKQPSRVGCRAVCAAKKIKVKVRFVHNNVYMRPKSGGRQWCSSKADRNRWMKVKKWMNNQNCKASKCVFAQQLGRLPMPRYNRHQHRHIWSSRCDHGRELSSANGNGGAYLSMWRELTALGWGGGGGGCAKENSERSQK